MKAPSRNITQSLKGQGQGAGKPESMDVQQQRSGGPTMTVPGDGMVESAPGEPKHGDRSAANYTEPQKRYGGG